jgi:hypothetical protein
MKTVWEKETAVGVKRGRGLMRALAIAAASLILAAPAAHALEWKIETIDAVGTGKFTSLRMDKDGNLHLIYVIDDSTHALKYGFWDVKIGRWFTMTVAEGASFASLTLDSKQRPHISWADHGTSPGCGIRYAYWDGKEWHKPPVRLDSEIVAYYTSIALDLQDRPSISFYEYRGRRGSDTADRMRVVTFNGKYWELNTVDGENQSGKFNAMASDQHGWIHLAYANVGAMTAGMRYAVFNGETWKKEIVEGLRDNNNNGTYVGTAANIALDKEGNPHISYSNDTVGIVKYATRKNGKWFIEAVDKVSRVGYPDRNGVTLDENGRVYLSYYDSGRGEVKIAYKYGDKWLGETVDGNGAGFNSSVQVRNGVIWVSYADEPNHAIKVAHASLAPPVPVPPPPPKAADKQTAGQRNERK